MNGELRHERSVIDGKQTVAPQGNAPVITVMLAVEDTPKAIEWYKRALGATELWNLGPVAGLEIGGAPFFLGQPSKNGWERPTKLGITSTRVEVFCDDPDAVIACALAAGAKGSHEGDKTSWPMLHSRHGSTRQARFAGFPTVPVPRI